MPSGLRSSLRSFNDFCSLSEVLDGSSANSRFKLSRPCLPASIAVGVENMEVDERRPIDGKGMISKRDVVSRLIGSKDERVGKLYLN
jgi:hypothetical protein